MLWVLCFKSIDYKAHNTFTIGVGPEQTGYWLGIEIKSSTSAETWSKIIAYSSYCIISVFSNLG